MPFRKNCLLIALILVFLSVFLLSCQDEETDDDNGDDDDSGDDDNDDNDSADDDDQVDPNQYALELLKKFQPLVIQKLAPDYNALPYPIQSDRIGTVSVHEGDEDFAFTVQVDTTAPVVYHHARRVPIRDGEHYQLLYAFFYPDRPIPFAFKDDPFGYISRYIYSGLIDGKVIRITLDKNDEVPLLVEVTRNCGCDWKLYVNALVDDRARQEYEQAGVTYPGLIKPGAPSDVPYVFIMPSNLPDAPDRVVFVAEEGWTQYPHNPLGVFTSYEQWLESEVAVPRGTLYLPEDDNIPIADGAGLVQVGFDRMDYDLLYRLPLHDTSQPIGLFDPLGYVWNGYTPLTLWMLKQCCFTRFPGTPRDKDDLEVVHETMDFWDVTALFEAFLNLPESLFGKADD